MTTYITFVMDETGSMTSLRDEAITGFNKYIDDLRDNLDGRVNFSMMKFDSTKEEWFVRKATLKQIPRLTKKNYRPGATTPLWDAVGHAIEETEKRIDRKKNPKVILTIFTDGYENASRYYTDEMVKVMIEEHDDWAINFLGANMDAWDVANSIGITVGSSINFDFSKKGIEDGFGTVSLASANFVRGKTTSDNFYEGVENAEEYVKTQ